MPKYSLSEKELNSLAAFILSLDFNRFRPKIIPRKDIIVETK